MSDDAETKWFSVRCVLRTSGDEEAAESATYEERVTLWRATSLREAIERAEAEAVAYAEVFEEPSFRYLGLAQAFHLFQEPVDGAEVFSLIRTSDLPSVQYLNTFFDTGDEHQTDWAERDDA